MAGLTLKTTHAAEALARFTSQYQGKPNLAALLATFTTQVQILEATFDQLRTAVTIDGATGVWLDRLGTIVGQAREGRDDTAYRVVLRTRIRINRSRGRVEDLLSVFNTLVAGPLSEVTDFTIKQYSPASVTLEIRGQAVSETDGEVYLGFLRDAAAAGVRVTLFFTDNDTDVARFGSAIFGTSRFVAARGA